MNTTKSPQKGSQLIFLKLGGSLITDKLKPRTPRLAVLDRLAGEIQTGLVENPGLRLLLGHGSGSFGHYSGSHYKTREGVSTPEEWLGFAEVWSDAADLNRLVMTALRQAGLPVVAFPPSANILTRNRQIISWELSQLETALENNLLPVVYGDVVFDEGQGGTILSTEDLFVHLAAAFKPDRILLAGQDPGVWQDYPACKRLYEEITPADEEDLGGKVNPSQATDVTGGMGDKVHQMLDLISASPSLEAVIFSGAETGNLQRALAGDSPGTKLHS
jgi:isopentenyl phosphate kinase